MGWNSWSLYQCPDGSIFDESSQQCLMKVPISDTFDQFALLSPNDETQFQKIANFFVGNSFSNEEQQGQKKNIIEPSLIKNLFNAVGYS
jgi:hypothetical protein